MPPTRAARPASSARRLPALFAGLALAMSARAGDVLLSEFMAINTNAVQDEDGDCSDWIEVHNAGTNPVDLAGWRLTDTTNNLAKWEFPSTNVMPGGFVLVFASDKNRRLAGEELHTNFKLDGDGEYLALVEPGGAVATEFNPYPAQAPNISFGLAPGAVTNVLLETNATCRFFVPPSDDLGFDWITTYFDDSAWATGRTGVGYDNVPTNFPPDYRPDVGANVSNLMFNINSTLYIRIPFTVSAPSRIASVDLFMKYDDGFVAYLNGNEVAGANDQELITWNAHASALHDATDFVSFAVGRASDFLQLGTNILAIHGLNRTPDSSDLLLLPRLLGLEYETVENGLQRFFQAPTPRAPNGTGTADLGPAIAEVSHAPASPLESENLVVTALLPPSAAGLSTVALHYIVMFTNEVAVPMTNAGAARYAAAVPASAFGPGDLIRYCVTAVGTNGATNRWPLVGDAAPWLGAVVQDPSVTSALPVLQWFVQDPAWHIRTNGGGNNLNTTAAFLHFDGRFYDGAQVRVRGQSASQWRKPHFKFDFSKGHEFLWSAGQEAVSEFNLQSTYSDKAYVRQALAMETYRDAGAPYSETFPVRVQQNGKFYSVALWLEQPNRTYLERQGLDGAGALYKMFNAMTNAVAEVEKKTRLDEPNTDLQALVNGVAPSQTAPARERFLFDNVDMAAVVNYVAATTVMHDNDHVAKNYYAYRDTEGDGEWSLLPWDKDLTFGRNYVKDYGGVTNDPIWANVDFWLQTNRAPSHPLFGDSDHQKSDAWFNRLIDAMHDTPSIRQMYLRRLRTLMDDLLQTNGTPADALRYESRMAGLYAQMMPDVLLDRATWGNPYGSNQTFEAALALLKNNYLGARRTHLFATHGGTNGARIPSQQSTSPPLQFGAIEFSPASSNQAQEYIELRNTNAFAVDISGWALSNAVRFTFSPGTVIAARSNLYVSPHLPAFRARAISPRSNESRFVVGPYRDSLSARGETVELRNRAGDLLSSLTYTGNPGAFLQNLRVTEIMYHPEGTADCEFIELKNIGTNTLNLSGVEFAEGIYFSFTNFVLGPSGLTVVVRSLAAFTNGHDPSGISIAGAYTGALDNAGERIALLDPANEEILAFTYDNRWHPATDGEGYSLNIANPLASHATWGDSNAWRAAAVFRGTPGREEPALAPGSIVINEAMTHSDTHQDWVELFNAATNAVDVGGWLLSDSPSHLAKFVIPAGTVIGPGAYRVFTENDFNNPTNPPAWTPFAFSELGDEIHLCSATGGIPTTYHEIAPVEASDRSVSFGRYVTGDGRAHFSAAQWSTPGASNAPPRAGPVVVSEIMYHPFTNGHEFIELHNLTNTAVALYDPLHPTNRWRLTSAVSYTFPANRSIPGGGYALVVPIDPSQFRSAYGVPANVAVYGPFTGQLNNAGETVRLRRPADPETNGFVPYVVLDEVAYLHRAPWPGPTGADGSSLEKVSVAAYGNEPSSWRAANVSGSPGTLPQMDANSDGLPDNWQVFVFGTTNAPGAFDWDYDGDPNQDEYVFGSEATNELSEARLSISGTSDVVLLTFPTREAYGPGYFGLERRYALESASSVTGSWIPGDTFMATNGTRTVPSPWGGSSLYYRVRAWLQTVSP